MANPLKESPLKYSGLWAGFFSSHFSLVWEMPLRNTVENIEYKKEMKAYTVYVQQNIYLFLFLFRGWFLSLLCFENTHNNLLFLNKESPDYPEIRWKWTMISLKWDNKIMVIRPRSSELVCYHVWLLCTNKNYDKFEEKV